VIAIPDIITMPPITSEKLGTWPRAIQAVVMPATGTSSANGTTEPT
jgi:hypothetical protein